MAGQNYTWQVSSPNIGTGVGVISSAYNVDNKSPFTTINQTNTTGYTKVFPNSTSTDFNIKNLEYAVQTDGKITYRVQDGTQNPRQFNSLQELADGRGGWSGTTTDQVKIQMNGILKSTAEAKNITPTTPAPSDPATDIAAETGLRDINTDELNKGIDPRGGAIKKHGDYRYPSEMPDDMDKIKFNMYTYGIRKTNPNFAGLSEEREPGELKGSVTLGIQPRISDTNSVSWNDLSANAIELAAAGASTDIISGGASAISDVLGKLGNSFNAEKSNIQEYAKTAFAGAAAGISGLTSRIGGVILNPNLELLFDSPQLRPFDFTFQLTPRDRDEAKQVKQIIRFFKQGMAVQRTETQLFLKAPNIFDIKYLFGQKEDHPGLNKIKRCALVSCSVDYTPTGSYMTFSDGTMAAYSITLSFKELEPVYSDQYQDPENDNNQEIEIGF
jgi:hypothetical protein